MSLTPATFEPEARPFFQPDLLRGYLQPAEERPRPYWLGRDLAYPLALGSRCPSRAPVRLVRARERDAVSIVDCDGAIAVGALDRVSVLARAAGAPRPDLPLPLAPAPNRAEADEWVDGVKLLHPRLLWLLNGIAEQFPARSIRVFSGYRRERASSRHDQGRALDISIDGVSNADVFQACRRFDDAGCGYYPNSLFVHVDVRPPGTGHAVWIDDSAPGKRAHYVDSWPGVLAQGGYAWRARR